MKTQESVVVITGASSGIGEATARLLGKEGFQVILGARRETRLQKIAEDILDHGGKALPLFLDMSDTHSIQNFVAKVTQRFGKIDVLVNNAGFGRMSWLEKLDPVTDIQSQFQVNLIGLIQITQVVLPGMLERNQGHIINVGSIASFIGTPTYSIYAASKFGVRGFNEALRREVRNSGIKVTLIAPGGVDTEFKEHSKIDPSLGSTTPNWLRLDSEDVAKVIRGVIYSPRKTVILPKLMWIVVWLNSVFPSLADWIIARNFVR